MIQRVVKYLLLTLVSIFSVNSALMAQQFPVFSQYFLNGLTINPAMAGSDVQLSLTSVYRNQWVNFEGAPVTYFISGHSSFRKEKLGIGLFINHDKIGSYSNTHIYGSYAYIIKSPVGKLALGLQAGFNVLAADFNDLNLENADGSFTGFSSNLKPNFGAGVYYHTKQFFAGFSVPFLLNNKITSDVEALVSEISEARYYYLNGGIILPLNREGTIELVPTILIRSQEGSPMSMDLNASLVFHKAVSVGLSYRNIDGFVGFLDLKINDNLLFAYSYDITTSDIRHYSNGTHEFLINYRIRLKKHHGIDVCPFYFQF